MREIKFRAWDETNNWMIPDFDNWVDFGGNYWTTPDTTHNTPNQEIVRQDNVILMQYTGFKDRNGKEIYEGDILKRGENIGYVWYCDVCARYEFQIPISGLPTKGAWQSIDFPLSDPDSDEEDEIIGNIYENIELLKK